MNMIRIENLLKQYGRFRLEIPELLVPAGQSLGIVGNNGAGKTTLFSLILDLIEPDAGEVYIKDIPVHRSEEWKKITAAFLDESFLIPYLTPEEYFEFLGKLRGISREQVYKDIEIFKPFFGDQVLGQNKYIRDLSKGNQKKVGIAGVFVGQPELVVLDEPFANLDPSSQIHLKKILKQLHETGRHTFLISSHNLDHITGVTGRIILLDNGHIIRDLPVDESTLHELIRYFEEQILKRDQ